MDRRLEKEYQSMKKAIEERLAEFEKIGKKSSLALFEELAFCILTPQSKAESCDLALRELKERGLLLKGGQKEIARVIRGKARFHNKKAAYLVLARQKLSPQNSEKLKEITNMRDVFQARERLLKEVKGLGLKEASHYLRNVGRGERIAILDRHVLKNLALIGIINAVPRSMSSKKYFEIEKKMGRFCKKAGMPMSHLDLLFWARETGKIFK
ncbi:MAG: N-glycosylase/DNA lyase [Candidatus Anstonellaceae archaeon]